LFNLILFFMKKFFAAIALVTLVAACNTATEEAVIVEGATDTTVATDTLAVEEVSAEGVEAAAE
jgi:hypothetical protein